MGLAPARSGRLPLRIASAASRSEKKSTKAMTRLLAFVMTSACVIAAASVSMTWWARNRPVSSVRTRWKAALTDAPDASVAIPPFPQLFFAQVTAGTPHAQGQCHNKPRSTTDRRDRESSRSGDAAARRIPATVRSGGGSRARLTLVALPRRPLASCLPSAVSIIASSSSRQRGVAVMWLGVWCKSQACVHTSIAVPSHPLTCFPAHRRLPVGVLGQCPLAAATGTTTGHLPQPSGGPSQDRRRRNTGGCGAAAAAARRHHGRWGSCPVRHVSFAAARISWHAAAARVTWYRGECA